MQITTKEYEQIVRDVSAQLHKVWYGAELQNAVHVSDAIHEGFLAALYVERNNVDKIPATAKEIASYVYKVANRKLIDEWRPRRRLAAFIVLEESAVTPQEEYEVFDTYVKILDMLPRKQRLTLSLCVNDVPVAESARMLGCTPESAYKALERAKKKFKTLWSKFYGGGGKKPTLKVVNVYLHVQFIARFLWIPAFAGMTLD